MANLTERITSLEKRILIVEQMLGVESTVEIVYQQPKQKEPEPEDEMINGFPKSQLRVMYNWAKSTKLQQLSKSDFEELKRWGMLWEFYPNAPNNFEEIIL